MSIPTLQILEIGASWLTELTSASHGADLDQAARLLATRRFDAVVLHPAAGTAAQIEHWPALSQAVQDAAVLVLQPVADLGQAQRLVQRGVEEVLECDGLTPQRLWRGVVLAVERQRQEVLQRKGGSIDVATGLPTRQQWLDHLSQLCALREREPAAMAVVVLRIEGLATVAQRLGEAAARSLQRKIAVRLRSSLRMSDLVGSLGNDAYAVLLAWLDTPVASDLVANKLVTALQRPYSVSAEQVAVSVCAGVARHIEHGRDAETLLRAAHAQAASFVALGRGGFANRVERGTNDAANDA